MHPRYDTISFLSDFGLGDEFVGVVKSVIRSIAPDVTVIDVTHEIPPHDVRAGSLALARAAQYLVPGVVLAVVDPGVGTDRRGVAVEVGDGQSVLIGPDNGLLAPAVGMVGGATRVVELTNPEFRLAAPGATFDGRDVFAPAAAHLCTGVGLAALGHTLDPLTLQPGMIPLPFPEGDAVAAQVLWVDRYGNAQLNVGPDDVDHLGERVRLRLGERTRVARRATSFAELGTDVGLVLDAYGLLAVCLNRNSAADELDLGASDEVKIEALGEATGGPVAVDIGPGPR
jgi:S-adenosyl-L-methionine hydrolase (adenosine-forming)